MKSLTIAMVTARHEPCLDWFVESLERRRAEADISWRNLRVIVVDHFRGQRPAFVTVPTNSIHCTPKPTVWSGPDRLTKQDWWSTANARNTALCLCETEWIAFLDDRCVLQEGWFQPILDAQKGKYIVAGAYEKRREMTAFGGHIQHSGIITGEDQRKKYLVDNGIPTPYACPHSWLFGCNFALPLEWALNVNGVDETCDGCGAEDVVFGAQLGNAGYPIRYDYRMAVVQDRTPGKTGPVMVKRDKGVSPKDKSHMMMDMLTPRKTAAHPINIRKLRENALAGFGFPKASWPKVDFWDQQPLEEMVPG